MTGARVHEVRPGSAGAESGLRRLDQLLRRPGRTCRLRVLRDGQVPEVALRPP